METLHDVWEKLNLRLRRLDRLNQKNEAELLADAYEELISTYQESRELNDEMEVLLRSTLVMWFNKVSHNNKGEISLPLKIFLKTYTNFLTLPAALIFVYLCGLPLTVLRKM